MSEKSSLRLLLVPATQPVQTILEQHIRAVGLPYRIEAADSLPELVQRRDQTDFDVLLLNCTADKVESLEMIKPLQPLPTIILVDGNPMENVQKALSLGVCPCLLDIADVKSLSMLPDFVERLIDCFAHYRRTSLKSEENIQKLPESSPTAIMLRQHDKELEERLEQSTSVLKTANRELSREIARGDAVEQTVHDERNRFRTLVETIPHGIVEFDRNWIITFANSSYHRIIEYPEGTLIGKCLWDILKPDPSSVQIYFEKVLREQPVPATFFSHRLTLTGKFIDLKVDWNYKRDANGDIIGFVVIITDITQQRRAEEKAQQRLDQLAHVSRVFTMNQMVSGLAHELNQPLTAISNFAQACRYRLQKSSAKGRDILLDSIEQISIQADRAGQIIRRLRDFVRRADSSRSHENINELVTDVLGLLEIEARAHGVQMETDLAADLPRVAVDRIQIEQVITNLAKNAMEATRELPAELWRVTLRTEINADGMLQVSVIDTGKGIKAKELDQVFEPFYTTKQSGMGLGLSISRSIVEAHGGRLEAVKNANRGMTFRFALPVAGEGQKA